jgi:allantoinase
MIKTDLTIRNARVVCSDGILEGGVAVDDGTIVAVAREGALPCSKAEIDAAGKLLLPGIIDAHVHFREPGYTNREDFITGSQAAAAGGVTTVLIMPICVPPTYSVELLEQRLGLARTKMLVDFGFYGAASADHADQIEPLGRAGVIAFKTFMTQPLPGREREFDGLFVRDDSELLTTFREIAKTGLRSCVHAENHALVSARARQIRAEGKQGLLSYFASRPLYAELEAASRAVLLAGEAGAKLGLCHTSQPEVVRIAHQARQSGDDITLETCPHYLLLTANEIEHLGPYAKIDPPLRNSQARAGLWDCLKAGMIDWIASDHAPYTLAEKELGVTDIWAAPSGSPSVELTLPLLAKEIASGRMTWVDLVRWCCEGPAKAFGLSDRKGWIKVGFDADLVLLDDERSYCVERNGMSTKSRDVARLYEGRQTGGRVVMTMVRGEIVMENGRILGPAGWGKMLSPNESYKTKTRHPAVRDAGCNRSDH